MDEDLAVRVTFDKHDEFSAYQKSLLSLNLDEEPTYLENQDEIVLLRKLSVILDDYQEQSYLLDPWLEDLTTPVVECLKAHAGSFVADPGKRVSEARVNRLSLLLHAYIKCRGYKTIVRYFPHGVADLSIILDYMLAPTSPAKGPSNWSLRYAILLWLSLVCMIPFDLAQFDDHPHSGQTAQAIESLAKGFLGNPGLEREAASILLSRLYMRKDTRSLFDAFLGWSNNTLEGTTDVFLSIGILRVLCEVIKSGPADQVKLNVTSILRAANAVSQSGTLSSNTVARRFRFKLLSRIAMRLLPARFKTRIHARSLSGTVLSAQDDLDEDIDVPEEVESVLEHLFEGLQDKDTLVRWSASKGISRISERLPLDFVNQVFDTILSLFKIHSVAAATLYDVPAIAEGTWHGACLACAEMVRRGLVGREKLPELIEWLSKALYFDIRRGAHSVGSSVRDAAAYVLWALARTKDASALDPYATSLAGQLVTVALYDREIHIRRAASAAFQEHVGRMGLFPHGIDVMRTTDSWSVSLRRNAFLVAAPQVAEYPEYRNFLFDHLLNVTLRHWDPAIRQLGAQSLQKICMLDLATLGPQASFRAAHLFDSVDVHDIHGGLLALAEIAAAYREHMQGEELEAKLRESFGYLAKIPLKTILTPRNEIVTAATCYLIANSVTPSEIHSGDRSSVAKWRKIIDYGVKHGSGTVQEAAASAMAAINLDQPPHAASCDTLIPELSSGQPANQQCLGRFLSALDYASFPHGLLEAIQCLLDSVDNSSSTRFRNVEARRNCYLAIPRILETIAPQLTRHLSSDVVGSLFRALLGGLNDYTVDERGDVGSWIRMACIQGLRSFAESLFGHAGGIPDFEEYLPPDLYHEAIGAILKQGVERLDGVRQKAGENFIRLLLISPPMQLWRIQDEELIKSIFLTDDHNVGWGDGDWLFPKAAQLLRVERYRKPVLAGIVLSIGSKTDSTHRPATLSLVTYSRSLPTKGAPYSLLNLVQDLLDQVKPHLGSNAVVVPVLQTFNVLLEANALEELADHPDGLDSLKSLLSISLKNVPRLKSIPRIIESMKILVNVLAFPALFNQYVSHLMDFLAHQFPKVRADTAEYLYLTLQTRDFGFETDRIEELLLETEWSSTDINVAQEAASGLTDLALSCAS